jgi:hypothetical protein
MKYFWLFGLSVVTVLNLVAWGNMVQASSPHSHHLDSCDPPPDQPKKPPKK